MSSQHLSQLCRESNVKSIIAFLKQKDHSCDTGATGDGAFDCDVGPYMSGIWSYQDDDGRTAFHWAVALENYDLARTLMREPYNAPVLSEDSSQSTPFMTACALGADYSFIVELLEKSAAVYDAYRTWRGNRDTADGAMHTMDQGNATQHRAASILTTENKFSDQSSGSSTAAPLPVQPPLSHSSSDGKDMQGKNTEAVLVESDAGARSLPPNVQATRSIVDWQDNLGNTALFVALRRSSISVIRLLLQYCGNISHQNKRGQSVLHRAVMTAKINLVEEMVYYSEKSASERKIHVRWMNLQDKNGDSALFYASGDENEEIGVFLLRHGADRHLRNKHGKLFWEV